MELIRGLQNLRERHHGCVLTIGNFDGLHRGHQLLIEHLRQHAQRTGLPSTVITFEPTPREFFFRDSAPARVFTFRDKLAQLRLAGVDRLLILHFNRHLATFSPADFIDELLVRRLGVAALVMGDDFHFGRKRSGNIDLLKQRGAELGFEIETCAGVTVGGERASSTALRQVLAQGNLAQAELLLGRRYSLRGRVRRGLQLGRKLGMPTANIELKRPLALRQGVYAVRAHCGARSWDGVASLGVRPTLGLTRCLLETHVFGDCGSLYGLEIEVEFHAFLRPELRFDSLDALAQRMQQDAREARELLGAT